MGHHPQLGALRRLGDHIGQRRQHARMQARFRLIERDQPRQAIGHQRTGQRQEAHLPVGQFFRPKQALRKLRQLQAEGCRLSRFGNIQFRAERIGHGPIEIDRVLPDMGQRREHRGQVAAILIEHRRGNRERRFPGRRIAVGAETMIKTPAGNSGAQIAGFRITARGTQHRQRCLRVEQTHRIFDTPSVAVAGKGGRAFACHHLDRSTTGFHGQFFFLDLRLEGKAG